MEGASHIKIHFFWNVNQVLFSYYSMLQGRARIQALIKITQTLFFFLLYNHKLLPTERIMESNDECIFICKKKKILDSFILLKPR